MIVLKKYIIVFSIFFLVKIASTKPDEKPIFIFAPSSLNMALEEIITTYKEEQKVGFTTVYLGTSQLVKQIENGADPDIFISANKEWMEYLKKKNLVVSKLVYEFTSNQLALITKKGFNLPNKITLKQAKNLLKNSPTKISLALVKSVPAGIYAKQFLSNIGIWEEVKKNVAQSYNVRQAAQYVSRGDLQYGIVYKSDATNSRKLSILYLIDDKLHKNIIYPAAPLNEKDKTLNFYNFLKNKRSTDILKKWGFGAN